nr:hypothetical protein StreXyl84_77370 [Streptomyces sp. Xyl84]
MLLPDQRESKLDAGIDHTHRWTGKLTDEQRAQWAALGMRW